MRGELSKELRAAAARFLAAGDIARASAAHTHALMLEANVWCEGEGQVIALRKEIAGAGPTGGARS